MSEAFSRPFRHMSPDAFSTLNSKVKGMQSTCQFRQAAT